MDACGAAVVNGKAGPGNGSLFTEEDWNTESSVEDEPYRYSKARPFAGAWLAIDDQGLHANATISSAARRLHSCARPGRQGRARDSARATESGRLRGNSEQQDGWSWSRSVS